VKIDSIQISGNELHLDSNAKNNIHHLRMTLPAGEEFRAICNEMVCSLRWKSVQKNFEFFDETQRGHYDLSFGTNGSGGGFQKHLCARAAKGDVSACEQSAAQFAGALNALRRSPSLGNFNAESFHQKASAWRALVAKPELSDEVHTRRLLAEDAIKNNQPEEALQFYDEGVGLDPTWAQGWFNAALVAAQLNLYADAALYMQNYLELVPEATDATSARDQIRVWKYKAQKK
jgi:tetratricopeptide (TPR) repeat protein